MKKPKTKATPLDRIAAQLHAALRLETTNVVEIGKLLLKSRELLEHGEWQEWLGDHFDLGYRTALRYCTTAEYAAKSDTVSHLANLSATVLYALAEGRYSEEAEKAILAAARKGRVDQTRAAAIFKTLKPPVSPVDDARDAAEVRRIAWLLKEGADDEDAEKILDGPPPEVPPSAPIAPPTDFALQSFNKAVDALKRLVTKPTAQFVTTAPADDLVKIIAFLQAVLERARANQTSSEINNERSAS